MSTIATRPRDDPDHLAHHGRRVGHLVHGEPAGDQVELPVEPGQRGGVTALEADVAQPGGGGQALALGQHLRGQVEGRDVADPRGQGAADVPGARRDIEHQVAGLGGQPGHDPVQAGGGERAVVSPRLRLQPELRADGVVMRAGIGMPPRSSGRPPPARPRPAHSGGG